MNEITFQGNYNDFKVQMDVEIKEAAEGFVRIGYLLKVARDTNVLYESGYKSVSEFAKAEYGLSADIVSRYIAINDKYSEEGYSDRLQDRYRAYGVAKLAEMLSLPDAIAEQIPADMTKQEIRDIKRDLKEEQKITDLEVMLEPKTENEFTTNLQKTLYEYFKQADVFKEYHETYNKIFDMYDTNELDAERIDKIFKDKDQILDVLAPSGMSNIRVRVSGLGRMMLVLDYDLDNVQLTNMRSMEKEEYSYDDVAEVFKMLSYPYLAWENAYFEIYEVHPERKEEIAPAQVENEPKEQVNTRKNEPEEAEKVEIEHFEEKNYENEAKTSVETKKVSIETEKVSIETENVSKNEENVIENKETVSETEENKEIVSEKTEILSGEVDIVPTLSKEEFEKRWIGYYEIISESTSAFLRALRNYDEDLAKIHLEEINKVMKEFFKLKVLEPEDEEEE